MALPDVAFEAALAVVELAAAAAFAVVAFVVEAVVLELELEPVVSVEAPELAEILAVDSPAHSVRIAQVELGVALELAVLQIPEVLGHLEYFPSAEQRLVR